MTLQTLFLREHNRLAHQFRNANPSWTDEQIFQEARKWVIAFIQHITINEVNILSNFFLFFFKLLNLIL